MRVYENDATQWEDRTGAGGGARGTQSTPRRWGTGGTDRGVAQRGAGSAGDCGARVGGARDLGAEFVGVEEWRVSGLAGAAAGAGTGGAARGECGGTEG